MANRVELPIVVLNDEAPYNPVAGASCVIFKRGTTSEVTVYSDSGATNNTITQPLSTDSAGRLSGWLARGAYDVQITIPGRTPYVEPFDAAPAKDGDIDTEWIANEAVTTGKIKNEAATTAKVANEAITTAKVAAANKDGTAGTASMRTLGTASTQAAAGNDSRLSDERTPKALSVTEAKIADKAVTSRKVTLLRGAAHGINSPFTLSETVTEVPGSKTNLNIPFPFTIFIFLNALIQTNSSAIGFCHPALDGVRLAFTTPIRFSSSSAAEAAIGATYYKEVGTEGTHTLSLMGWKQGGGTATLGSETEYSYLIFSAA